MNIFHTELQQRWSQFSIFEQMANVGTEVGRCIAWRKKQNQKMGNNALYRALELLDFTIADIKNTTSLAEICRVRELLVDYFMGENIYHSTHESWERYFFPFNLAARRKG